MIAISSVIRCVVEMVVDETTLSDWALRSAVVLGLYSQATKRIRWMPWQSEAMKDVEACDKVRGAGKRAVIRTSLNGETHQPSGWYLTLNP